MLDIEDFIADILFATTRDCLGTYNATQPYWTDTSVNNAWRSWFWIV